MIQIVPLIILILAVLNLATDQQKTDTNANGQPAASVRKLEGNCLIRNGETGTPRKLKSDDQLQEGQQIQCEAKAKLIIKFQASGAEKEIRAVDPKWYVVPNVPAFVAKSKTSRLPGREKGGGDATGTTAGGTNADRKQEAGVGPIRSNFDAVDIYWKARKKYFLLVAASKSADTSLPFTKVDAAELSKALTRLGYEPLGPGILQAETATSENVVTELQKTRTLSANASVIVYYSGHAAADPSGRDLWLQLYGQKKFGDHYGLSVDDLIGSAKGNTYKGELSIILDTCFSGRAANSTQLKESQNTVVFTSSSYQQPSVSMGVPPGIEMSAFTYYLIQGLSADWPRVDGDADGIIMYSDLGVYIGNKLTERFRDRTLLGPMQPQLFGGFNRNWVGYDAGQARNFDTEPRKTVALERAVQLQDPDITRRMLDQIPSAYADFYLRALQALENKKFVEAMELLDAAEKEGRVSLAQIYWARGTVKIEQMQLAGAREWLDKAVAASESNPNADLVGYDGAMHFALGNWPRAEELFKQVLQLPAPETTSEDDDDHLTPPITLFFLSMINLFQGDTVEADLYLKRLKEIDPEELEAEEEGFSFAIPVLEILSDVLQEKTDSAKSKLEALRRSTSLKTADNVWDQMFERIVQTLTMAVAAKETGKTDPTAIAEHFAHWDAAVKQGQFADLLFLLTQTQILAAASDLLNSKEAEDLLARTVKFAEGHKVGKPDVPDQTVDGVQVIIVKRDEKELMLESATLLVMVGQLYAIKRDFVSAEKFLKEGISIQSQQEGGATLSLSAVVQLADLYQQSQRFTEAEKQFKDLLKNLSTSLGGENLYASMILSKLGELYEAWQRPKDAEASYREALRLALRLGSDSVFAIEARQTLADFLSGSNNYAEAAQLYEAAIRSLEQNAGREFLLRDGTFGDLHFSLSKSYYGQSNFDAAEKSLSKVYTIFSSASEPILDDIVTCLQWQWATAIKLKKQDDADAFYKRTIDVIQSERAKPKPVDSLGASVVTLASWFKNWDSDKSEQLFHMALDAQTKNYGVDTPEVGSIWTLWAELKEARSQYSTAINYLNTARNIYQKQTKLDPVKISYVLYKIGVDHYYRQEFEQAQASLKESNDLLATVPANLRQDSFSRNEWPKYVLGRVERILKNYETARTLISSTLDLDLKTIPVEQDSVISDLLELAAISRLQQKYVEAEGSLTRAQTYLDRLPADKAIPRRAKLAHERGMLALVNNQAKQAESLLREAVEQGQKDPEMDPLQLAELMDDYAHLFRQRHKEKDAGLLEEKAKRIRETLRNGN